MFNHSWLLPLGIIGGGILIGLGGLLLAAFVAWSIFWKGLALWRAAQRKELYWFIALLLVNTLGVLEILYIYVFSKHKETNHKHSV